MPTTNFTDKQTVIEASWLNDVDAHTYDQASGAHTAANITNVPAGSIAATTVQAAINEIDGDVTALETSKMDNPLTTRGDLVARGASVPERLAIGATGYILQSNGTDPQWVPQVGMRNKIIGGDFGTNPWQRGTTFTAPAAAAYVADRWQLGIAGTSAVVDVYKLLDAPTAAQAGIYTQYSMHFDVTTADAAVAAGDVYNFQQKIEGINAAAFGFGQSGTRYATLSFWVKAAKTGIHCVALQNSALDRSYVKEYTISVANTWEYKTLTFPVDTTGTWLYAAGTIGVRVIFTLLAGSTFQTTADTWVAGSYIATSGIVNELDNTANNFRIALVQFEPGQVATPFEQRDYGTELNLCRRYLPAFIGGTANVILGQGHAYNTTDAIVFVRFDTPPMTRPTGITVSNAGHLSLNTAGFSANAATGIAYDGRTSSAVGVIIVSGSSGLVSGNSTAAQWNNSAGYLLFTGCEL